MASQACSNFVEKLNDRELKNYVNKDHGSLVSLSSFSTVGSLMGYLTKGSMLVEGRIARGGYISLYRMALMALHGVFKTCFLKQVGRNNLAKSPKLKRY
ncbi:hypothetical protein UF05_08900 [Vibrio sp. S457-15]|nr:hypothetical protein UF05_08900 [Vibrio sp. S457-15]